jgi:hypothetical protein
MSNRKRSIGNGESFPGFENYTDEMAEENDRQS